MVKIKPSGGLETGGAVVRELAAFLQTLLYIKDRAIF